MKPLYNLNDIHAGVIRSGGTTPATSVKLRLQVAERFGDLLGHCNGGDVIINGDLFDEFMVPFTDLWRITELSLEFLARSPESCLYVCRGNHDIAKNTTMMSAFDLYCRFLGQVHQKDRFVAITEPFHILKHKAFVIPHMPNQDLFDLAMAQVKPTKFLFVHCNYDNKFAMEKDHSLNMTPDQARDAPVDHIIFGHEHQRSSHLAGKVVVVGNQIPSSVSDCLGNDAKYALKIHDGKLEFIPVWDADSPAGLARVDWRALKEQPDNFDFVRVEGEASSAEAAEVISAIAKFRTKSQALVVSNAVQIDGVQTDEGALRSSLEDAKGFDVIKALLDSLEPGYQRDTVSNIIEKHNVQTRQID